MEEGGEVGAGAGMAACAGGAAELEAAAARLAGILATPVLGGGEGRGGTAGAKGGAAAEGFLESVEEFVRKTGGSLAQMETALVGFTRAQAPPLYTAGPGAVTGALETIRGFHEECGRYAKFIRTLARKLAEADLQREAAIKAAGLLRGEVAAHARRATEQKEALARQVVEQVRAEVQKLKQRHQAELVAQEARAADLERESEALSRRLGETRAELQAEFTEKLKLELTGALGAAQSRQRDALAQLRLDEEAKRAKMSQGYEGRLQSLQTAFQEGLAQEGSTAKALEVWVQSERARGRAGEFRLKRLAAHQWFMRWRVTALGRRLGTEVHAIEELREELVSVRREAALSGQRARVRELRLREKLEAALREADRPQLRASAFTAESEDDARDEGEGGLDTEGGGDIPERKGESEGEGAGPQDALQRLERAEAELKERDLHVSGERALLEESSARGMVLSAQVRALEGQLSNEREVGTSLADKLMDMQKQVEDAEADRGRARRTAEDARTAARMAEEALMRALGERDMARRQLQDKEDQASELQGRLKKALEELKFLKLQRFNDYKENEGSNRGPLPCF